MIGTKGYELAPYGIMQPKDDPAFKKVVDGAVLDMIKNGKVAALYEKYFIRRSRPSRSTSSTP